MEENFEEDKEVYENSLQGPVPSWRYCRHHSYHVAARCSLSKLCYVGVGEDHKLTTTFKNYLPHI